MKWVKANDLREWITEAETEESGLIIKGEWRSALNEEDREYIGTEEIVYCSFCGAHTLKSKGGIIIPMLRAFSYCPVCGADMRGDE